MRTQKWDTHEETGPWMPLASAPALNYLGGYEIGYRLQAGGFQTARADHRRRARRQPDAAEQRVAVLRRPHRGRRRDRGGRARAPVRGHRHLHGHRLGQTGPGGASDCLTTGESTTASFGVDVHVDAVTVRQRRSSSAPSPLPGNPFVGVRAPAPPGGQAEVRCTLNATTQAGRAGPEVPEFAFPRPGAWTCVARGTAEGQDENYDTTVFGTPWSAPLAFEVRSDFRRRTGQIARPRSKRPRFTFTAEFPDVANGGRGTVKLYRVTGCRGRNFKLRKVGTYRGRFGAKRMRITMRRPRSAGFYLGRFSFSGTHLLNASTDPNPMRLLARSDRVEFAPASGFPGCPGYRP